MVVRCVAILIAIALMPEVAIAQMNRLAGTVIDNAGDAVADASIMVHVISVSVNDGGFVARNAGPSDMQQSKTNGDGKFVVFVPHAGTYQVSASKPGVAALVPERRVVMKDLNEGCAIASAAFGVAHPGAYIDRLIMFSGFARRRKP